MNLNWWIMRDGRTYSSFTASCIRIDNNSIPCSSSALSLFLTLCPILNYFSQHTWSACLCRYRTRIGRGYHYTPTSLLIPPQRQKTFVGLLTTHIPLASWGLFMNFANNQLLFSKTDRRDHRHHLSHFFLSKLCHLRLFDGDFEYNLCRPPRLPRCCVDDISSNKKTRYASCPTFKLKEARNNFVSGCRSLNGGWSSCGGYLVAWWWCGTLRWRWNSESIILYCLYYHTICTYCSKWNKQNCILNPL